MEVPGSVATLPGPDEEACQEKMSRASARSSPRTVADLSLLTFRVIICSDPKGARRNVGWGPHKSSMAHGVPPTCLARLASAGPALVEHVLEHAEISFKATNGSDDVKPTGGPGAASGVSSTGNRVGGSSANAVVHGGEKYRAGDAVKNSTCLLLRGFSQRIFRPNS